MNVDPMDLGRYTSTRMWALFQSTPHPTAEQAIAAASAALADYAEAQNHDRQAEGVKVSWLREERRRRVAP